MNALRKLGLAAIAALAMTAFGGAGSALAATVSADEYPATFAGTGTGGGLTLSLGSLGGACNAPEFRGSLGGASGVLASSMLDSSTCSEWGTSGLPLKANGCQLELSPGEEIPARFNSFEGAFAIGPKGCGPITYRGLYCEAQIPAQSGFEATFVNSGEGSGSTIEFEAEASGIRYTMVKGIGVCAQGEASNGVLSGSWAIEARNAEGEPDGIRVEPPAGKPLFEAESYPATASGIQTGKGHVFTGNGGEVRCESVGFSAELAAASNQVSVTPSFGSSCTAFGYTLSTISTNGCTYQADVTTKLGLNRYSGSASLVCPEGKQLTINAGPCTVKIPPQNAVGTLEYVNHPASGDITVNTNLSGIKGTNTKNNFLCFFKAGEFTNGAYTGSTLVSGNGGVDVRIGG